MRLCYSMMALFIGLAGPAFGQTRPLTPQQQGYEPVEQLVGDVDPLHTSMRRVESGLWEYGQGSSVFRQSGRSGQDQRLYFVTQGYTASYDRSQYFAGESRRGELFIFQEVPPNTVFHIGLPQREASPPQPPAPHQVTAQVDRRVNGQPSRRPADSNTPSDQQRRLLEAWRLYTQARQTQVAAVLRAIDRVAAEANPKP